MSTSSDRWQFVKQLLWEAMQQDESDRAAFLDRECAADASLRAEVESLLQIRQDVQDNGFLDSLASYPIEPRLACDALADFLEATISARPPEHATTVTHEGGSDEKKGDRSLPSLHGEWFGNYELLDEIGRGGMGVVYKARQVSLNRVVALKMVISGRLSSQEEIDRFLLEAEAAAALDHPGIVPVFEVGQHEGRHFYSMALIEGQSLSARIKSADRPLAPKVAARLLKQIAQAVHHAHSKGIVHRDLKPANIMIDTNEQPRVMDFGLAKQVEVESGLTMSGQIMGTPNYMPPEQAAGQIRNVGPAADVYALGAILYAVLTGRPPFSAANVSETLQQVIHDQPVRPRLLNSSLPKDLETICLKCLEKDPDDRYESAAELGDELQRFLEGRPILAQPIGAVRRTARWCRRKPTLAALLGLSVIAPVIIITVLAVAQYRTTKALKESDASFLLARTIVDEQFTNVSEKMLLNKPGLQPVRQELLESARDYYHKFLELRGDDPGVRQDTARINFRLGLITQAIDGLDDAMPLYFKARDIQQQMVEARAGDEDLLAELGDTWNAIGNAHMFSTQVDDAQQAYKRASELRDEVAERFPQDVEKVRKQANSHMNVGVCEKRRQNMQAARSCFLRAQELRNEVVVDHSNHLQLRADIAMGYYNLADTYSIHERRDSQDRHDHEGYLDKAVSGFEWALALQTDHLGYQYKLGQSYHLRAKFFQNLDANEHRDAAVADFENAIKVLEELTRENTEVRDYRASLAGAALDYASFMGSNSAAAHNSVRKAEENFRRLKPFQSVEEHFNYVKCCTFILISPPMGELSDWVHKTKSALEDCLADPKFEQLSAKDQDHVKQVYEQLLKAMGS